MPRFGDPGVDLAPGQLPAFAGLGALGHLDLQLLRVHEVVAGYAEPAGRDLLDRAAAGITAGQRLEALRVFAALTGVAFAA